MFEQAFKNIDDILHKDAGCTSELDYTEQSSWLLFLKYLDALEQDKSAEAGLEGKKYTFILAEDFRWDAWAAPKTAGGKLDHNTAMTGDDLRDFVNTKLFPYLHGFKQRASGAQTIEYKIGEVFGEIKNKIQNGYNLRDVIDLVDELRFQSQTEKHELSHLYEAKIKNTQEQREAEMRARAESEKRQQEASDTAARTRAEQARDAQKQAQEFRSRQAAQEQQRSQPGHTYPQYPAGHTQRPSRVKPEVLVAVVVAALIIVFSWIYGNDAARPAATASAVSTAPAPPAENRAVPAPPSAARSPLSEVQPEVQPGPIEFAVSLEVAEAAVRGEIRGAYDPRMLPTVSEMESRFPVFHTTAGAAALQRLKVQVDEKLLQLQSRPMPPRQTAATPARRTEPQQAAIQEPEEAGRPSSASQMRSDVKAAATRAVRDYPYLVSCPADT